MAGVYGHVSFEFRGVTQLRVCPTKAYYDTLMEIGRTYPESFRHLHGSRERPLDQPLPLPQDVPPAERIIARSQSR
jgi:hypothetical protein